VRWSSSWLCVMGIPKAVIVVYLKPAQDGILLDIPFDSRQGAPMIFFLQCR